LTKRALIVVTPVRSRKQGVAMGRKPLRKSGAMTAAERQRRRRAGLGGATTRYAAPGPPAVKRSRSASFAGLRAAALQRKKERRAAVELALAEKINRGNRKHAKPRMLGGLPIISGG
jgi:hypothetical protein